MQGVSQFSAKDWRVIFLFSFPGTEYFHDTTVDYFSCFRKFRLGIYFEVRNQPDRKNYILGNRSCIWNHN